MFTERDVIDNFIDVIIYYLFTDSGYFIATDAYLQRITAMFAHQTEKALPSAGSTWKIKPNSKAAMPK